MQGISKSRHTHLIDALLQIEQLLNKECECLQQANEYRMELETMHNNYERLLNELARQIIDYEMLYSHIKTQFLSKKLKELKREISVEMPDFLMLQTSIKLVYST